ncbi:hypothetical protein E2C01_051892 [Portunus trituberculatus]|uniref:Uncharacterized protein n=1 Tax=Portunus trituberculatus TaxID=210409 RepID=A0A5B7GD03_PORTR|nr:hypothetical protein [Portunus trituberculatus]
MDRGGQHKAQIDKTPLPLIKYPCFYDVPQEDTQESQLHLHHPQLSFASQFFLLFNGWKRKTALPSIKYQRFHDVPQEKTHRKAYITIT